MHKKRRGRLYQVRRASNSQTTDIGTLTAGGFANAAAQDTFCAGTTCTITIIYDQTSRGNHLGIAPAGGNGSADVGANATALPLTAGGHPVYGIFVSAGVGYRDNSTSGIATGSGAEGMYMVASGTHVNSGCCFDYGNAETNNLDNGNGHMEAIYLGRLCWFSPCSGAGPWVMADLENGLFAGGNGVNSNNTGRNSAFVTAMLKGNSSGYAIKDGNAQSGGLKTDYNGALPTQGGYNPIASAQMSWAARPPTAPSWSSGPAPPPTTSSGPARRSDRLATVGGPARSAPALPYRAHESLEPLMRSENRPSRCFTL